MVNELKENRGRQLNEIRKMRYEQNKNINKEIETNYKKKKKKQKSRN